jgi:methylenetetrahydrofolate dehydrogenase (NADP+)/methenyltetrahydrofolate cyclohydrolase
MVPVPAELIDGRAIARSVQAGLRANAAVFTERSGIVPCLAAVLVGHDPASEVYIRNKRQACSAAGLETRLIQLKPETTTRELLDSIQALNDSPTVHGILVQLPLPRAVDASRVLDAVHPLKDVDCFHPENVGRLVQGRPRFRPCTPWGVLEILAQGGVSTVGKEVVVLGRSEIVGKPLANMLLHKGEGGDATVTICHSRSALLAEHARRADILVAAIGRPRFVTAAMVKPGAVVIDVGINRTEEGLVGDVDFKAVSQVAGKITPVPGGVGPMTVAMLLANTLEAARLQVEP